MSRWQAVLFGALGLGVATPYVAGLLVPRLGDFGSPGVALAAGLAFSLLVGQPFPEVTKQSKPLLQVCVVLLGFSMNLGAVLDAGRHGFLFALGTIATTLLLGAIVGRLLGVNNTTSTLISAGTAICGGSAIAAVGGAIGAAPGEMSVAMGTVFVLNAAGLYLFPAIGHALGLSPAVFGTWAGVAIHDVSSVVGAASAYDPASLPVATAVKLSRAIWIVPLSLGAAWLNRAERKADAPWPWFIGGFLVASLLRTLVPALAPVAPVIVAFARAGFAVVLFLIGASLSKKTLQTVGWRPMVQGLMLWLFISVVALLVLRETG